MIARPGKEKCVKTSGVVRRQNEDPRPKQLPEAPMDKPVYLKDYLLEFSIFFGPYLCCSKRQKGNIACSFYG